MPQNHRESINALWTYNTRKTHSSLPTGYPLSWSETQDLPQSIVQLTAPP